MAVDVQREADLQFNGHPLPRQGEGMGVATRPDEIVTAAHVVWGAARITITDARGGRQRAAIARIDPGADIALLRIENRLDAVAELRSAPAQRGERVGALQHTTARVTLVAAATVWDTRWRSHGVPAPLILTGIKGRKGMSGGGLFDASGKLLGIIIRIDRRLGYLSALPVVELCLRFERCASEVAPS